MRKLSIVAISLFGLAMSSTDEVKLCAGYKEEDLYAKHWKLCLEKIKECGEESNVKKTTWAKNDIKEVYFDCKKWTKKPITSKQEEGTLNNDNVHPSKEEPITQMQEGGALNYEKEGSMCAGYKQDQLHADSWTHCLEKIEECAEEANVQRTGGAKSDRTKVMFECKMCAGYAYRSNQLSDRAWDLCVKKIKECGDQSKVEIDEIDKKSIRDVRSFRCVGTNVHTSMQEGSTPNEATQTKGTDTNDNISTCGLAPMLVIIFGLGSILILSYYVCNNQDQEDTDTDTDIEV